MERLRKILPVTLKFLSGKKLPEDTEPESFIKWLNEKKGKDGIPEWIADLALLEFESFVAQSLDISEPASKVTVNSSLRIVPLKYSGILEKLLKADDTSIAVPSEQFVGIWKDPYSGQLRREVLSNEDLLALKIVLEEIPYSTVKNQTGLTYRTIETTIKKAASKGLLVKPPSRIRRPEGIFSNSIVREQKHLVADIFTLQWHITQACDLHCRHCYDRSVRQTVSYEKAMDVIEDLWRFCKHMNVKGQISFSGGNPLLHPRFFDIYRTAYEMGFQVAILGNPVPEETIQRLIEIAKPVFYQVSLEGLREENDYIRGRGNFDSVFKFLDVLKKYGIYSMVMLTLTERNIDHVIPLARELNHRADLFTFNRLASVGEGASLRLPSKEKFMTFLEEYLEEASRTEVMGLKDNLFNLIKYRDSKEFFGGCTGYGCGAAFNFVALLSDGEVHACRKFPSYIGNIYENSLIEIYNSPLAEAYRNGPAQCRDCEIAPLCRGCMAVIYGMGKDPFQQRDPYCFKNTMGT